MPITEWIATTFAVAKSNSKRGIYLYIQRGIEHLY